MTHGQPGQPHDQPALPPFIAAYNHYLDQWHASGRRDIRAEEGMRIAALGALRTREPGPRCHRARPPAP